MKSGIWIICAAVLAFTQGSALADDIALKAPSSAAAGSTIEVSWTGLSDKKDFITIVLKDAPEKKYSRGYAYARDKSEVELVVPEDPGEYEIRYLAAKGYATRARLPFTSTAVSATLEGPAEVVAGAHFDVSWTGPGNKKDYLTIIDVGAEDGKTGTSYQYTRKGKKLKLLAPEVAGDYEVRYLTGDLKRTLAVFPVRVTATSANIMAPASVPAGAKFDVQWTGPGNRTDFLALVEAGAKEGQSGSSYDYPRKGKTLSLTAPEAPGDYEIRYVTGARRFTLASVPLTVGSVSASLESAPEIEAEHKLGVGWTGPGNERDYVVIVPVGDERNSGSYAYVNRGPKLRISAPAEPGEYEVRYVTGREKKVLASNKLRVLASSIPGTLRVVGGVSTGVSAAQASTDGAAIIVILDASGSMLQRLDGRPRIDVAKEAVGALAREVLPEGSPFALRVFGHNEKDSCRTELEVPLGPLDAGAVEAKLSGIRAINRAKTPIARSLQLVAQDLKGASGEQVVVLVTDGEETCDGDPEAAIRALRASGVDVRVNIVGFAIEELMLRETFEKWAQIGGGSYFDARDASALQQSMRSAMHVAFEVLAANGEVVGTGVVGGAPIKVRPGTYRLRERTGAKRVLDDVKIVSKKLQTVSF